MIDYDKLLALRIPDVERTYTARDPIFYALSLGLGQDPVNTDELPFVYEDHVKVLPTFPVVVAQPGFWARDLDTGIDWVKVVAGEYDLTLHRPLAPQGAVRNRTRVLVSDMAGRTSVSLKAKELGIELDEKRPEMKGLIDELKEREFRGYEYEAADASFRLLVAKHLGVDGLRLAPSLAIAITTHEEQP